MYITQKYHSLHNCSRASKTVASKTNGARPNKQRPEHGQEFNLSARPWTELQRLPLERADRSYWSWQNRTGGQILRPAREKRKIPGGCGASRTTDDDEEEEEEEDVETVEDGREL